MRSAYLYVNAALYLLFAIWCTVAPSNTSSNLGYQLLSRGGQSEYLVIYGGLQVGLALIFWMLARTPAYARLGLDMSIALYAPIVLYRAVTVAKVWPVPALTVATGCLESVLLVAALCLRFADPS